MKSQPGILCGKVILFLNNLLIAHMTTVFNLQFIHHQEDPKDVCLLQEEE